MECYKPEYFDQFVCVAGACPDTCCAGWQIMIDEDSLEFYGEVEGSFGKRLRNSIDWMEGCFYQREGRCAFLNHKNLCDIYSELGPETLCDTCRLYPRHVEEYEGIREWSLSLSCPVAAKMLLTWQGEVMLLEEETEEEENPEEFEDFDSMLYMQLVEARRVCFEKLWEENFSADAYMKAGLDFAKEMQLCVEAGEYFRIEEIIREFQEKDWTREHGHTSYEEYVSLFEQMKALERLRTEWDSVLEEMGQCLYKSGKASYECIRAEFAAYMEKNKDKEAELTNVTKQLLFFFLYTYFCGGVYDDWIYSKMALCTESVRFILELFLARWMETGKLDMEDYVELSYRYAREIEHSDLNLNELEEIFIKKVVDN